VGKLPWLAKVILQQYTSHPTQSTTWMTLAMIQQNIATKSFQRKQQLQLEWQTQHVPL